MTPTPNLDEMLANDSGSAVESSELTALKAEVARLTEALSTARGLLRKYADHTATPELFRRNVAFLKQFGDVANDLADACAAESAKHDPAESIQRASASFPQEDWKAKPASGDMVEWSVAFAGKVYEQARLCITRKQAIAWVQDYFRDNPPPARDTSKDCELVTMLQRLYDRYKEEGTNGAKDTFKHEAYLAWPQLRAMLQGKIEEAPEEDYVAWARYHVNHDRPTTIVLCDSNILTPINEERAPKPDAVETALARLRLCFDSEGCMRSESFALDTLACIEAIAAKVRTQ